MSALLSPVRSQWLHHCEAQVQAAPRAVFRLARGLLFGGLLLLIFVPEYAQAGSVARKSMLYQAVVGGFRVVDILVLSLALVHGFAIGCCRHRASIFPRRLKALLAAFAIAIAISIVYGMEHGGRNFFFDWRALALGLGFYVIYRCWIQTASDARAAVLAFGVVAAIRIASLLLAYLRGQGDSLLGVSIPLFDGPTISALVFTAILGIACFVSHAWGRQRWLWLLLSAGAMLMVGLCFRRTYWAEMAIAIALLALITRRQRLRILALPLGIALVTLLTLGTAFTQRLSSMDFTRNDAPYSQDNADHVGDVLDAWAQVRAAPVMGIGLGRAYSTRYIRAWKEESVMVHNAPLHVWLKYGLLGLAVYLAYHLSLFRSLRSRARRARPGHRAIVTAVLAYVAAQFMVSLAFTPWPYSALQSTDLIAFLMAVAFISEPSCHYQRFRLSPLATTRQLTWKTQYSA